MAQDAPSAVLSRELFFCARRSGKWTNRPTRLVDTLYVQCLTVPVGCWTPMFPHLGLRGGLDRS
jgi:hypothetical protein